MIDEGVNTAALGVGFALPFIAAFVWGVFAMAWTVFQRLVSP